MILAFDNLEELRPLSRPEFNFRKLFKLHHEDLLHLQFVYWKQRCTIRWIKVGEENSKFFQAIASTRFRRNTIASLMSEDGVVITDHNQNGRSVVDIYQVINMCFDLESLIDKVPGFEDLSTPFSQMKLIMSRDVGPQQLNDVLKLNEVFRSHSSITINMGDSVLFWSYSWTLHGSTTPLRDKFPRLFSVSLDGKLSVQEFINDHEALFHLTLSTEAMAEL